MVACETNLNIYLLDIQRMIIFRNAITDRGPNRGRYGNFTGEDGHNRGGYDRNGREGSYGHNRDNDRGGNDRYGNYNNRRGGNDRRPQREFHEKPAGPVIGKSTNQPVSIYTMNLKNTFSLVL